MDVTPPLASAALVVLSVAHSSRQVGYGGVGSDGLLLAARLWWRLRRSASMGTGDCSGGVGTVVLPLVVRVRWHGHLHAFTGNGAVVAWAETCSFRWHGYGSVNSEVLEPLALVPLCP